MRRLPAEWELQAGVLLTWPHPDTDWGPLLAEAEATYQRMAVEISRHERVAIVCADEEHKRHVSELLEAAGVHRDNLGLHTARFDDTWIRDYGPITVIQDGQPLLLNFSFDGWGGKYNAARDNGVTCQLSAQGAFGNALMEHPATVMEGGSIDSDGDGTLLTTRRCLTSRHWNNPSPEGIADQLQRLLGVDRVVWLDHGHLAGDDTDGHVDTLARFCDPQTIAYVHCDDPEDVNYRELSLMEVELRSLRTRHGRPYHLVPLPLPAPRYGDAGERLPASYANFLIINDAVLIPQYDDPADAITLERLATCFADRAVVGIPCSVLIRQYGSLHCVTMQVPAEVSLK